jgi:hypothetical protein
MHYSVIAMTRRIIVRIRIIYGLAPGAIAATIVSSYVILRLTLESNIHDSRVTSLADAALHQAKEMGGIK